MDKSKTIKGLRNPFQAYQVLKGLLKGEYYRLIYRILNGNVRIEKNFKMTARLSIRKPGRVFIGDNVEVDGTSHPVTPWATDKNAEIKIWNNVYLNGTRFGCTKKIEIGENCILADCCRILDTDFHSLHPYKRNDPESILSAPIKIGDNVWAALGCVILKGVTIGNNSTISAQSVVYGNVEEGCVYGGNPAVSIKMISMDWDSLSLKCDWADISDKCWGFLTIEGANLSKNFRKKQFLST